MKKFRKNLAGITASHGCAHYGFVDLENLVPEALARYHRGISFVFQIKPWVMDQLDQGPTDAYSVLYKKEHFYQFHGGHNCGICRLAIPDHFAPRNRGAPFPTSIRSHWISRNSPL